MKKADEDFKVVIQSEFNSYIWQVLSGITIIAIGRTLDYAIAIQRAGRALTEHGEEVSKPYKEYK